MTASIRVRTLLNQPSFQVRMALAGWHTHNNPVYIWQALGICIKHDMALPTAALDYLAATSRRMHKARATKDLRSALLGIIGFPAKGPGPGRPLDPDSTDPDRLDLAILFGIELEGDARISIGTALRRAAGPAHRPLACAWQGGSRVMTEIAPTETDATDALTEALISERGGSSEFSITQLAVARRCAHALAGDGDPKDIVALMAMLPPVRRRIEVVAETPLPYSSLDKSDAPREWDLSLLADHQLALLEELAAVAQSRAVPIETKRMRAAVNLVALLNGSRDEAALPPCCAGSIEAGVHNHVYDILSPRFTPAVMFKNYLPDDRLVEIANLKARLARAEDLLTRRTSGPAASVVSLAAAKAAREAPTVASSNIDTLNGMLSSGAGFVGDYPAGA